MPDYQAFLTCQMDISLTLMTWFLATDIQCFQEKKKNVITKVHELIKGRNWRLELN